jgi:hypothetical protein
MTLLALASVHGAPGVTTMALTAAAVAAETGTTWLVEADPSGGVLAARCAGLHGSPGVEALAYPDRRADPDLALAAQPFGALAVVVGPYDPARASAALARPRVPWTSVLFGTDGLVVVDAGRVHPGSPADGLLLAADTVWLVTHPEGVDLVVAAERRDRALADGARSVGLVTSGAGAYSPNRLSAELGAAWFGAVPHDPRAVDLLQRGASPSHRRLTRSPLVRAVRDLLARTVTAPLPAAEVTP